MNSTDGRAGWLTDGRADGLEGGRTGGRTDGRMDGWMDALTIVFYFTETSLLTFHYIFLAFGILTIVLAITTLVKLSNVSLMKPCTL